MENQFIRSEALIGKAAVEKLKNSAVIVFGIGGVGSFTAEMLARGGVGKITLVDCDCVSVSNLNRQLVALHSTLGKDKAKVMKQRIEDINPECSVNVINCFYLPENADCIDLSCYDYIADAVDTVSAKLELIKRADSLGIPVISCMGTGNKFDPLRLRVSAVEKTQGCPLCKVMRRELRLLGIKGVKAVWSDEEPKKPRIQLDSPESSRHAPASLPFVPSSAGILMAKEIIFDLIGDLI